MAKQPPVKKTAPTKQPAAKAASVRDAPAKAAPAETAAVVTPVKLKNADIAAIVAGQFPLVSPATVGKIVEGTLQAIARGVATGNIVEIKDFAKLEIKDRPARTGRNPKTGETIQIAASKKPVCTFNKKIKDLVK